MNYPTPRLLWKEYRSLRWLWIGVTLGTLAIWGAVLLTLRRDVYRDFDPLFLFWVLAWWLPPIYALACVSAQFAGESEERTASWLINLGSPPRPVFSAKLLWTWTSTVVMQLILFTSAWQIRLFVNARYAGPVKADELMTATTAFATSVVVEAIAWGLFWSLQRSNALQAMLFSAISLVGMHIIIGMVSMPQPYRPTPPDLPTQLIEQFWEPWGIGRILILLGLFAVDAWLARRWLTGRMAEWSIPWSHVFPRLPARAVSTAVIEPPTAFSRAWQRLRWLEWQSLRGYFRLCILLCLPSVIWCLLIVFSRTSDVSPPVLPFVLTMFLPLIAGLAAWHGEQSRQQFRFLINRGVSPAGLWWNKFGLWALACAESVGLFVLLGLLIWILKISWSSSSIPTFELMSLHWQQRWRGVLFGVVSPLYVLWPGALLFLGSFTMGLYFRRGVFAVAAGLMMLAAVSFLTAMNILLGLPSWLGFFPVAVWLLWCGWRHLPRWALEQTGWRKNVVITAEWLVFPAMFAVVITAYWVYAVPSPDVSQIVEIARQREIQTNLAARARSEAVASGGGGMSISDWRATDAALTELVQNVRELFDQNVIPYRSDAAWTRLQPAVKKVRDALLDSHLLKHTPGFFELSLRHTVSVERLLMDGAERALVAGNDAESLLYVRAAVRFGGAVWSDAPFTSTKTSGKQFHEDLHQRLVQWAHHPQQKSQLVSRAISEMLANDFGWWTASTMALETEYQLERQRIDEERSRRSGSFWSYPFWQAARDRRLAAVQFSNRDRFLQQPVPLPLLQGNWVTDGGFFSAQDRAWNFREPGLAKSDFPVGIDREFLTWSVDREIRLRCTLGMMAVVAFRQAHGRLPKAFDELSPEFGSIDRWRLPRQLGELRILLDGDLHQHYPYYYQTSSQKMEAPVVYMIPSMWSPTETYAFSVPPLSTPVGQ